MSEGPGPTSPTAASGNEPTRRLVGYGQSAQRSSAQLQSTQKLQPTPAEPGRHAARRRSRTAVAPPHSPAEAAHPHQAPARAPAPVSAPDDDIVRYGPGVPAAVPGSLASRTAETRRRTGRLPRPSRRRVWLLGSALAVILLAACGIILYLRSQHAPFQVANVEIAQQTHTRCGADVTGLITTNGAAGTISYEWLSRPSRGTPQPLSQTVVAGQDDDYVTVAVPGLGHGRGSEVLTLQVLGPQSKSASTEVVISCR
jgi:hypothetical protein